MTMFVKVSVKDPLSTQLINLDTVQRIIMMKDGSSTICMPDPNSLHGVYELPVMDKFSQFDQFSIEPISSADVQAKIEKLHEAAKVPHKNKVEAPLEIPKL